MSHITSFRDFALSEPLLECLSDLGYSEPTPIQQQTIPPLLAGEDVLGQSQTGTGKTAAFALPLLCQLDKHKSAPQVLVLAPTRELAQQVAESFKTYGRNLKGLKVAIICGGQSYRTQLLALKQNAQVVVGTPGRIMDHMRRGSLDLGQLNSIVLDEADEMLRMGFIDDVKWVLEHTPKTRQTVLFSATMPNPIREIAKQHLNQPKEITVKSKTATVDSIEQGFLMLRQEQKLDALLRILEADEPSATIVFVKTKASTLSLASALTNAGYKAIALNGDISQNIREETLRAIKKGRNNILVATDVAARGIDIERISHVVNYDIPHDPESYVHRIGRTGRAGRSGKAILFITPRERYLLRSIERVTKHRVEELALPSTKAINQKRVQKFKDSISATIERGGIDYYRQIIQEYQEEHDVSIVDIAAALALKAQGFQSLKVKAMPTPHCSDEPKSARKERAEEERPGRKGRSDRRFSDKGRNKGGRFSNNEDSQVYRVDVGRTHGVAPEKIVGAIANETGIKGRSIGRIKINKDFSTVDLPKGLPKEIIHSMKSIWVCGKQLNIRALD